MAAFMAQKCPGLRIIYCNLICPGCRDRPQQNMSLVLVYGSVIQQFSSCFALADSHSDDDNMWWYITPSNVLHINYYVIFYLI